MSRRRRSQGSREEAIVTLVVLAVFAAIFLPAVRLPAALLVVTLVVVFLVSRTRRPAVVASNVPASLLPVEDLAYQQPTAGPRFDFAAYRARPEFFWWSEASFYRVLAEAVAGRYVIFPKVRLLDICDVPSRDYAAQNRIDKKHVDFLLCDRDTFRPVAAIELDGSSHQRRDRAESDAFKDELFRCIGLPLLRFKPEQGRPDQVLRMIERATGRIGLTAAPR